MVKRKLWCARGFSSSQVLGSWCVLEREWFWCGKVKMKKKHFGVVKWNLKKLWCGKMKMKMKSLVWTHSLFYTIPMRHKNQTSKPLHPNPKC
jgi:hypothetical protein